MTKLPWLQLYPSDWEGDAVAGCSLAAQALWLRMMFIMHRSERYGYLCQNGSPIPPGSIAQRCGCTLDQYDALFVELEHAGVPSKIADGTIFSRRMVRDELKRKDVNKRVKKHRCNAHVTHLKQGEVRGHISEVRSQKEAEDPAQTAAAFKVLGHDKPFGHSRFRRAWREWYANYAKSGSQEWLNQVMEEFITDCQQNKLNIPPQFYEAKHDQEKIDKINWDSGHRLVPL